MFRYHPTQLERALSAATDNDDLVPVSGHIQVIDPPPFRDFVSKQRGGRSLKDFGSKNPQMRCALHNVKSAQNRARLRRKTHRSGVKTTKSAQNRARPRRKTHRSGVKTIKSAKNQAILRRKNNHSCASYIDYFSAAGENFRDFEHLECGTLMELES